MRLQHVLLGVSSLVLLPAAAHAALTGLDGWWSGQASIQLSSATESMTCRVTYIVDGPGKRFTLRCANPSWKFESVARLTSSGTNVQGSWEVTTHNLMGKVSGTRAGDTLNLNIAGDFAATFSMKIEPGVHRVTLTPKDQSIARRMTMTLRKGG